VGIETFFAKLQHCFIIIKRQIRVHAALEQDLGATQVDCLLDFSSQGCFRKDIRFRMVRMAIKGAKTASGYADIGVVDIPINHISDHRIRM